MQPADKKLISQLLLDSTELRDVVAEFVNGLGDRIAEMKTAVEAADWSALAALAHQLKGAGGSYGYPDVSEIARTIEMGIAAQRAENLDGWIARLELMALAARAGLAEEGF